MAKKLLLFMFTMWGLIANTSSLPTTCEPCQCFHFSNHTLTMTCFDNGPRDMNWDIFPRLDLYVHLENISDFAFNHFPSNWRIFIVTLNAVGCNLQDIDLTGFKRLKKLRIDSSTILNATAVNISSSIEDLSITNCGLDELLIPYEHPVEVLDVSGNKLITIPVTNNVTHLNVSHNHLFGVQYSICNNTKRLATIDLSHNRITDLLKYTFQCLISGGTPQALKMVNLAHNSIRTIDERTFAGQVIKEIKLDNNYLTSINKNVLNWIGMESIDLQHNPWNCECSKQWMLDLLVPALQKSSPLTLMELRCSSPNKFKNQQFALLLNQSMDTLCRADCTTLDQTFWTAGMVATLFFSCLSAIILVILAWFILKKPVKGTIKSWMEPKKQLNV